MISAKHRYSEANRTFETLKVELKVAEAEDQAAKAVERKTLAPRARKVKGRERHCVRIGRASDTRHQFATSRVLRTRTPRSNRRCVRCCIPGAGGGVGTRVLPLKLSLNVIHDDNPPRTCTAPCYRRPRPPTPTSTSNNLSFSSTSSITNISARDAPNTPSLCYCRVLALNPRLVSVVVCCARWTQHVGHSTSDTTRRRTQQHSSFVSSVNTQRGFISFIGCAGAVSLRTQSRGRKKGDGNRVLPLLLYMMIVKVVRATQETSEKAARFDLSLLG